MILRTEQAPPTAADLPVSVEYYLTLMDTANSNDFETINYPDSAESQ